MLRSVPSTIRDPTPLYHVKSTSDHVQLPKPVNRQLVRFRRVQRPFRMYRSTIHNEPGS